MKLFNRLKLIGKVGVSVKDAVRGFTRLVGKMPPAQQLPPIFSHGLSPAELERLVFLSEKTVKVQQAIDKIIRFGYRSKWPKDETGITNRRQLERSLGHEAYALYLLTKNSDIAASEMKKALNQKKVLVNPWFKHQTFPPYRFIKGQD